MVHYPPSGDVLGLDDKLLTIILGALLAGAGMAVCFTAGGATGGTDIVAKIFHKYWGVAYGKVIIYTDILIIGSTLLVGYGLSDVVYGYIVTVVVGTSVDLLMAGSQQSNQIFIVTADYDRMAEAILHEADRGVTLIDATAATRATKSASSWSSATSATRDTSCASPATSTPKPSSPSHRFRAPTAKDSAN